MDLFNSIYSKTVVQNEKNLHFWGEYLNSLKLLNLEFFSDKLTVPVMVPVGSRILFKGELKHTNEVTVALGADYFAKCSNKQAEVLRQHRIKDAQSKVDMLKREKQYLEKQILFSKKNIHDAATQEIVEVYSENEDKAWRKKHKENVKQYKLQSKNKQEVNNAINDEELWNRLEELELQEELENELVHMGHTTTGTNFVGDEKSIVKDNKTAYTQYAESSLNIEKNSNLPDTISKLDLFQQVLDKQNELEHKLQEMKQREKHRSKTETDLISRLDEMEELDDLEDEMDRLDDLILSEDAENSNVRADSPIDSTTRLKHSVYFSDENDAQTMEITFKHSEVQPSTEPYNAEKGFQKPSDVYAVYKSLFSDGITSILKKTGYESDTAITPNIVIDQHEKHNPAEYETVNKTIVIQDIREKQDNRRNSSEISEKRPTSLFKKKRMQKT